MATVAACMFPDDGKSAQALLIHAGAVIDSARTGLDAGRSHVAESGHVDTVRI
jgi:hypothetical protein